MNRSNRHMQNGTPGKQDGVVLIIAMIILLLLSILGITAMSTNTLEERMAGNLKDKNTSLQAGEAALRAIENTLILALEEPPTQSSLGSCGSPPCEVFNATPENPSGPPLPDLTQQSHSWWLANGREYGVAGATEIPGVIDDPRFFVELIQFQVDSKDPEAAAKGEGNFFYRVTARGTGGSNDTQSIVQTTVRKRFN